MTDTVTEDTVAVKAKQLYMFTTTGGLPERKQKCEDILADESIPFELKKAYVKTLMMLTPASEWGYTHFSGGDFAELIRYNPPKQKDIKKVLANKNLSAVELVCLFVKNYNDKVSTTKTKIMILNQLPDSLLVEHTVAVWNARESFSVPERFVFNRMKKAHQMEDVPDEWVIALLNA